MRDLESRAREIADSTIKGNDAIGGFENRTYRRALEALLLVEKETAAECAMYLEEVAHEHDEDGEYSSRNVAMFHATTIRRKFNLEGGAEHGK